MSKRAPAEQDPSLLEQFDIERFVKLAGSVGHGAAIGYAYRDHGEDWVELGLDPKPELVGVEEGGILASGAIVSLMDMCGGAAVFHKMGKLQPIVTIDLRLDYLRPATIDDRLVARCECYKMTRSVAFVRGQASLENGDGVANMVGTFTRV